MALIVQVNLPTSVQFHEEEFAFDGILGAVQVAEEIVSGCVKLDPFGGHLDGPDQLQLALVVVVSNQVLLLGQYQLEEHVAAVALEAARCFQGGAFCHQF